MWNIVSQVKVLCTWLMFLDKKIFAGDVKIKLNHLKWSPFIFALAKLNLSKKNSIKFALAYLTRAAGKCFVFVSKVFHDLVVKNNEKQGALNTQHSKTCCYLIEIKFFL